MTLYDANERAGGLGDHGIVPWRLPRETVAVDVAAVERAGARFVMGTTVGRDVEPAALLADHDAVVLAIGLGHGKHLGIPGEELGGVVDALDLIGSAIDGGATRVTVGRRVGVIGGGSTAFDAAAAAVRLGADEVTLFYRRSAAECPAYPHAIELARSLGVTIRWLTAPVEIVGEGSVWCVAFESMTLGEPDASGRRRPERDRGLALRRRPRHGRPRRRPGRPDGPPGRARRARGRGRPPSPTRRPAGRPIPRSGPSATSSTAAPRS